MEHCLADLRKEETKGRGQALADIVHHPDHYRTGGVDSFVFPVSSDAIRRGPDGKSGTRKGPSQPLSFKPASGKMPDSTEPK